MVRKGDADRFMSVMAAVPDLRRPLFTLYAFNVEVARAPWASHEEMIAEMRLQFWHDVIKAIGQGDTAHQHELVAPLRQVIGDHALPVALFEQMIAARRWDIYRDPFKDAADFERYIDHTSGNLMWLAARIVGVGEQAESAVRDYAYGVGVANWLVAVPELVARGRLPLLDGPDEGIVMLARGALARIGQADKTMMKQAAPALRAGWQARGILKSALRAPARVDEGRLIGSEFSRRGGLLLKSITGRW
ncbi:MAG: squalene/phytoene synthase family protein [Marinosulfonomonas sp.]|nr:squalene/phytoene synthase family protein [Marinosulfonomonas sp.]